MRLAAFFAAAIAIGVAALSFAAPTTAQPGGQPFTELILAQADIAAPVASVPFAAMQVAVPFEAAADVITVPWGDWVATLAGKIWAGIGIVAMWLLRRLPGQTLAILMTWRVDQLLARAVDFATNQTRGAVKGKTLDVTVGNEVLRKALQFAADNGNKLVLWFAGGDPGLADKLIGRIPTEAEAVLSRPPPARPVGGKP